MDWNQVREAIEQTVEPIRGQGTVASYIPALAAVDPRSFGMAVQLGDSTCHCVGDVDERFSIQSISKVFTLSMALHLVGEELWSRVGREPSGSKFNSIVQLEHEHGIPRNPLINAGAIVVADHLVERLGSQGMTAELLHRLQLFAGDSTIAVDEAVAASEAQAGSRNFALASYMKSFGNLHSPIEETLAAYFAQCSISMSCRQLARAGLFLAFNGRDPVTDQQCIREESCRRINALMMLCGHYDNSGDFAYRIGLPGKSGVGGGILVVAPRQGSIAVWSPGLNEAGTSMVGSAALETLIRLTGWSVFG